MSVQKSLDSGRRKDVNQHENFSYTGNKRRDSYSWELKSTKLREQARTHTSPTTYNHWDATCDDRQLDHSIRGVSGERVEYRLPDATHGTVPTGNIARCEEIGEGDGDKSTPAATEVATFALIVLETVGPGLAVHLSQKYGSKHLLNVLSALGLCASYAEAALFQVSALQHPAKEPPNDSFAQFVFDNADVNISTIDGFNTFHSMGGIQCVTPQNNITSDQPITRLTKIPSASVVGQFGHNPIKTFESIFFISGIPSIIKKWEEGIISTYHIVYYIFPTAMERSMGSLSSDSSGKSLTREMYDITPPLLRVSLNKRSVAPGPKLKTCVSLSGPCLSYRTSHATGNVGHAQLFITLVVWTTFTGRPGIICPPTALPDEHARTSGHGSRYQDSVMDQLGASTSAILDRDAPSLLPQLFATLVASMGTFSLGTVIGYAAPASPQLVDNSTHVSSLHITLEENTWFSSIIGIGALAGGPLGGVLMKNLGRKGTIIASCIPYLSGWILIAFAQNFAMLLSGRILTGLSVSISSLLVTAFITEFSSANFRGALCSVAQLNVTLGILYAFTFGATLNHWPWLAVVCMLPTVMHLIGAFFIKESPYVLLARGRNEEARESLQFYRGKKYNVENEMKYINDFLDATKQKNLQLKDLKKPNILEPLLISLPLMFFQQFTGINAITFNMIFIFKETGSTLSDSLSSIIIGIVQVVGTGISIFIVDKAGRRFLLLLASGCMSLSLMGLGTFFYLKSYNCELAATLRWLPFLTITVFIFSFSIGFGSTPWMILSELNSPNIKEWAVSIGAIINWSSSFVVTVTFDPIQRALGDFSAYFFFCGMNALAFIFCFLFVPETKGKTLEEIGAQFEKKETKPSTKLDETYT
ncbi:facilitated trehalose transporter Tret1-like [Oratosquilla oratoria]|uniref:facilitated trehalose transporter Tret1-like n=1 Tax=Oratosquilla oratoria TaxID=337810 RepID=UPI003F75B452